jgi:hypothetical protein
MDTTNTSPPPALEPPSQPDHLLPPKPSSKYPFILLCVSFLLAVVVGIFYVIKKTQPPKLLPDPSPPVSRQVRESPTDMPVAWKTYATEGISFQYPPDMILNAKGQSNIIHLSKPGSSASYTFEIGKNTNNLNLHNWIQKNEVCGYGNNKPAGTDLVIQNTPAIRIQESMTCPPGGGGKVDTVYISKNKNVYQLYIFASGIEVTQMDKDLFQQIINSIQFPTEDMKKYTNDVYNFQISIPAGWNASPGQNNIVFGPNKIINEHEDSRSLLIQVFTSAKDIDAFIEKDLCGGYGECPSLKNTQTITVSGVPAKRFTNTSIVAPQEQVVIAKQNSIFVIGVAGNDGTHGKSISDIDASTTQLLNDILPTFAFIQ